MTRRLVCCSARIKSSCAHEDLVSGRTWIMFHDIHPASVFFWNNSDQFLLIILYIYFLLYCYIYLLLYLFISIVQPMEDVTCFLNNSDHFDQFSLNILYIYLLLYCFCFCICFIYLSVLSKQWKI